MNLRSCLAAVLTVAISAGCGSASSSKAAANSAAATRSTSASTATAAASSTAPAATASAATSSAQASASAAASATSAGTAPTSAAPVAVGVGSSSDFCKTIATTEGILTTAATAPHDPSLPEMMKRLHALAAKAPAAIRSDLAAIADFDQKIVDGFASGKPPAIAETPELKAAMLHEALWVQKNCS